ncbi:MAG: sulfatase [Phycisphaerae bacterium]
MGDEERRRPLAPAGSKPNIVMFLVDTLRADRLGAYGYTARRTSPHIDALAAESVLFEQASSAAPWTLPSVASLFTSTYPCEHQLLARRQRLNKSFVTLAQQLRREGYLTISMFANAFVGSQFGLARGFEIVRPSQRNNATRVGGVLSARPEHAFFLYVHNMEPHDPHHYAPRELEGFRTVDKASRARLKRLFDEYKRAGEHDYRNRQPLGTTDVTAEQDAQLQAFMQERETWSELYDACVFAADRRVGTVIDLLKQRGLWDNTIFILLSDHGEELGDHGGWLHDQSVYQELLHVPLIIRFPHGENAGRRVREPVSLVDVMPTLLSYLGVAEPPQGMRGRDLGALVRGEPAAPGESLLIAGMRHNTTRYYRPWAEQRGDVNIAVRGGWWKGIWNVGPDRFELYDLGTDAGERNDVASANAALVATMRTFARGWYETCRSERRETETIEQLDEQTLRNLRALGYVE